MRVATIWLSPSHGQYPHSLSPYVQYVETSPDHRDFGGPTRMPMGLPLNMPQNNIGTFHDPSEASVIALAKDVGTAEPLHVTQIQWEENKAEIKRIYLDKDRSSNETVKHMESLGFVASSKLYKEKLKEWNFLKNLSGDTAYRLLNHAQERKLVGKGTHYKFAPAEITYATPSAYATSPFDASSATPATPSDMNKENGREEELWYPRFTYDGNSKSYYDDLVSKAGQLLRLGQHTEALEDYLDALAGYRDLLSPTNDLVTSLVYRVAQLYMQLHDTKAADRILESATETYMLQDWARQNEALPPVLNLLQRQKHEPYSNLPSSSSTISANFDTAEIRRHLAMAEMIASVMDETTKAGLVAIAQRCEAQPLDFPQQTLDALVALIRTYKDARDVHHVQDALSRAAVSVRTLIDSEDETWTIPFFSSLLSLMEVFIGYGKHKFVDGVLLAAEEQAEYTLYNSPDSMIDLFLRMDMLYQGEDVWEEADHYFQYAQAASANASGRMNTWTKTIEDARRQQHYEPKLLSVRRV
ncbi:hypothetical protein AG0111_0g12648 [Alternaria gaisen]|uniref:Uncharacterized protein n=1 Tax=Alternaria gaisen TaxID=167740 RepID=A0ACB6F3Y8_9PLEO|nr:hypothetical protein AG0111_0g12648 [Alternaria gaisen]